MTITPSPLAGRLLEPAGAGLVLLVHVVVLDLAELPEVGRVDELLEHRLLVVEREPEVADATVGKGALGPGEHVVLAQPGETAGAEAVQQVEVDRIELQPLELLAQQTLRVVAPLDLPHRQLGGDLHAAAQLGEPGSAGPNRSPATWRSARPSHGSLSPP